MTETTHGKNDTRFDDLLVKARDLGRAAGTGKDTLVQFGLLVVNAAYDGVLDLTKDKHGTLIDDAVKAYSEYGAGLAEKTIFDHKSPTGKVQAAKLRTCIKLGTWTRGGPGEPIQTLNKLMGLRHKMRANPVTAKTLDDAYNTLLRYARVQIKQNGAISDDKLLREFCVKPVSKTKTLEEYLQGVVKHVEDLRVGRAASGTLQRSSPHLVQAIQNLKADIHDLRSTPQDDSEQDEGDDN